MDSEQDLAVIEDARQWFFQHLQGHPPIKVTEEQYVGGVRTLSDELLEMSKEASRAIRTKYGCCLTHNQASIALLSAMNNLRLIEIV